MESPEVLLVIYLIVCTCGRKGSIYFFSLFVYFFILCLFILYIYIYSYIKMSVLFGSEMNIGRIKISVKNHCFVVHFSCKCFALLLR